MPLRYKKRMKKEDLFSIVGIKDMMELPAAMLSVVTGERGRRDVVYRALIDANDGDMSHDWFQPLYEAEMSERKQKKQDFTPVQLGEICSELVGDHHTVHEPTAGNGSMVISDWWRVAKGYLPWLYRPSCHMVTCWELSDRSLPLLLFNLSVRGIMGYVYHGDVLEQRIIQKYILLNHDDNPVGFSDVVAVNEGARIERMVAR